MTRRTAWSGPVGSAVALATLAIALLISLAAPPAGEAHTCSLSSGVLAIDIGTHEDLTVSRSGANFALSSDAGTTASCGATVNNVATVDIDGPCGDFEDTTCGGGEEVVIDLANGQFAPGVGDETGAFADPEIEFLINLDGSIGCSLIPCPDGVTVLGSSAADTLAAGNGGPISGSERGINVNGDNDRDVIIEEVEFVRMDGRGGADLVSGAGHSPLVADSFPLDRSLFLDGSGGSDAITGGAANDDLTGGSGTDTLAGGGGDDEILTGDLDGADDMTGGDGEDSLNYLFRTADLTVTVDGVADDGAEGEGDNVRPDLESIHTASGDDRVVGSEASERIETVGGQDQIDGGGGDDAIRAGQHADVIRPGPGDDEVDGGVDGDLIVADAEVDGADLLDGDSGIDEISYAARSAGVRLIANGVADDGAEGEGDNVTAEILRGGSGDDVLGGDLGAHQLFGEGGRDAADYSSRESQVTVTLNETADDGAEGESDDVRTEDVIGGSADDVLTGGGAGNRLQGLAGEDTLSGAGGDDALAGGEGNDTEFGNSGADRFDQSAVPDGADALNGGFGQDAVSYSARTMPIFASLDGVPDDGAEAENDDVGLDIESIFGGAARDVLAGGAGRNAIRGGAGRDRILGRDGNDDLRGQVGSDALRGQAGNDRLAGGPGRDACEGGPGRDRLIGCEG